MDAARTPAMFDEAQVEVLPLADRLEAMRGVVDLIASGEATAPSISALAINSTIDEAVAALKAPVEWEDAAKSLCDAVQPAAARAFQKVSEEVYGFLLSDVQTYLRDNATFNLTVELERARQEAADAREQLSRVTAALGTRHHWTMTPANVADAAVARIEKLKAAEKGVAQAEREALAKGLRERADWLKSEYSKGGSFAHLHPREQECRGVADMIERGRFSAMEPV